MYFIQYYSISVGRLLKEEKFAEHYQTLCIKNKNSSSDLRKKKIKLTKFVVKASSPNSLRF